MDLLYVVIGVVVDPQDDVFAEIQWSRHFGHVHMDDLLLLFNFLDDEIGEG